MISIHGCLYSPKPCIHDDISFYIICFFNQFCFIKALFQPGQQGMCWATMSNDWSHWFHLPASQTECVRVITTQLPGDHCLKSVHIPIHYPAQAFSSRTCLFITGYWFREHSKIGFGLFFFFYLILSSGAESCLCNWNHTNIFLMSVATFVCAESIGFDPGPYWSSLSFYHDNYCSLWVPSNTC